VHIITYFVDLGVALLFAVAAVWYIEPTTAGGVLVIIVIAAAATTGIARLIRWVFRRDESKLVKPEHYDVSNSGEKTE
jgi:hypothetical protein